MYSYNNEYRQPEYEQPYNNEWEMELDPELEMESDTSFESDYENGSDFENDYESDYESDFESGQGYDTEAEESYETDTESDQEFETDMELEGESDYEQNLAAYSANGNSQNQYETDLESELEFVTNEMEFENWVRKAVTRDHRSLKPIVRTPAGRNAIRQISSIASRILPRLGIRAGGWRGRPFVPGQWRGYNVPFVRPVSGDYWRRRRRYYPYNRYSPYYGGVVNTTNMGPENNNFQNTAPMQSQDAGGGGGMSEFRKFVMDTFKNLSEQIAMGNNNLAAIKESIANSAVNNLPGGQTGGTPPPADTTPTPPPNAPTPNTAPQGTQPEWETGDYEFDTEMEGEAYDNETGMNEEAEIELASELLSVGSERELDQFFGNALKAAFKGVSDLLGSPEGKLLKSALKKIAKKTLPGVGGAIGTFFGGPLGTSIGTKLGTDASQFFELEMEGLSPEDQEFETAKALVRLTDSAGKQLAENSTGSPEEDAKAALIEASRMHAPGLLTRKNRRRCRPRRGGAWFRRGNRLIIEGI